MIIVCELDVIVLVGQYVFLFYNDILNLIVKVFLEINGGLYYCVNFGYLDEDILGKYGILWMK